MKYFAKWLPIEGGIKEGNKGVLLLRNSIPTPHKLFLCSRDIQAGDKVQFSICNGAKWKELLCIEKDEDGVVLEDGEYEIRTTPDRTNQCFKIIGQISTQATWIKEGDEFEFEDLQFAIYPPEHERAYEIGSVHIKCPTCKTFH